MQALRCAAHARTEEGGEGLDAVPGSVAGEVVARDVEPGEGLCCVLDKGEVVESAVGQVQLREGGVVGEAGRFRQELAGQVELLRLRLGGPGGPGGPCGLCGLGLGRAMLAVSLVRLAAWVSVSGLGSLRLLLPSVRFRGSRSLCAVH